MTGGLLTLTVTAQNIRNNPTSNHGNKFEQLGTILNDPNYFRTASGAPGVGYWQQRADYHIKARLEEDAREIHGEETITYYNNSPDELTYVWLQLDENEHDPNSDNNNFDGSTIGNPATSGSIDRISAKEKLQGLGTHIVWVKDEKGKELPYTINQTMMRVDLRQPLPAKGKLVLQVKWWYHMSERNVTGGRGGYEYFPSDKNDVFTVSQWYPRMCVYSDFQGWQNKQFTGRGEFALTFGHFKTELTVPADHVIAATGECQNLKQMLSAEQFARWQQAQKATEPIEIVTLEEAKAAEKNRLKETKTWIFEADSVRDFAWGTSRKFIWDAFPTESGRRSVMCMSFYPKEAYALYRKYSSKVVAHTIRTYSKYTIPYSYPVAISVEASAGMEYPMISFNYGRTAADGTYSESTKYGMIGVIIHEVGHNFFPMIVNSDERQWTWMDEGLNTFVQFLTEQEFDNLYPSQRGPAYKIVDYMRLPKDQLEPIMTNSENIVQFGNNAYHKPTAALNILRETIMGRKLFDFAFKEYCRRWAFKHPTPADFFRTMEDASGVDLDWFWRGWFFDIEPVDISMDAVKKLEFVPGTKKKTKDPEETVVKEDPKRPTPPERVPSDYDHISRKRNREEGIAFQTEVDTNLRDLYYHRLRNKQDYVAPPRREFNPPEPMDDSTIRHYNKRHYYEITFSNKGGTVMPIIIQWQYEDGSTEDEYISAYIWRKNENKVVKTFVKDKLVKAVVLDPYHETADIDESNNAWPKMEKPTQLELYKASRRIRGTNNGNNPMQKQKQGKNQEK